MTDDDDASGSVCEDGMHALYECDYALFDDYGEIISLSDAIAWCEDGNPEAYCVAECGVENSSDCGDLGHCAEGCF